MLVNWNLGGAREPTLQKMMPLAPDIAPTFSVFFLPILAHSGSSLGAKPDATLFFPITPNFVPRLASNGASEIMPTHKAKNYA